MSTTELKIRIELILDGVDTTNIIQPVTELAALSHAIQTEFLENLNKVATISVAHANSLMHIYARSLANMERTIHNEWLNEINTHLSEGQLEQASGLIDNYLDYSSLVNTATVHFHEVAELLEKLVNAVSGREFSVKSLPHNELLPYTDGSTLFVPKSINLAEAKEDNFLIYKVMLFQLYGQLSYGTREAAELIADAQQKHGSDFLERLTTLDALRINLALKKHFPGVWSAILKLHSNLKLGSYPDDLFSTPSNVTVFDCIEMARQKQMSNEIASPLPYRTNISAEKLYLTGSLESEKIPSLMNIDASHNLTDVTSNENTQAERISLRQNTEATTPSQDERMYHDAWSQVENILSSFQEEQAQLKHDEASNTHLYPEWDGSLGQYRQNWCRVEEKPLTANAAIDDTLLVEDLMFSEHQIKRTLDRIINHQKQTRHQDDGDDIDIDAWVEASSNRTKHADDYQRMYIRNNRSNRSVAIMFAIDISGSTEGWKSEIIRQSIYLLARTLSKTDDRFAIFAFSGSGREKCEVYPVKRFNERYSPLVNQRILAMRAKQYTRMGAAIRHLSQILKRDDAKTKVLFVLTDGRPDDLDSYRGQYGIEDTRRAFNEAKALSLNPFVLTFDKESSDYLPYMLGKKHYRLVSDITALPIQISSLYKQLTT